MHENTFNLPMNYCPEHQKQHEDQKADSSENLQAAGGKFHGSNVGHKPGDEVISTNLSAAYYLINAATPHMREQFKASRGDGESYAWGRILNIGSTAGLYGNFGHDVRYLFNWI